MAEVTDQEFVETIVKAIVDNPTDVSTSRSVDERGVLIELTVNPADMGKIIGKEGKTAKSIRTLLRVLGAKSNARVNLKIVEPEGSTRPESPARSEVSEEKSEIEKDDTVKEDVEKVEVEKEKEEAEEEDLPTDVLA